MGSTLSRGESLPSAVCIIATLDTKYAEAKYIKDKLEAFGLRTIVVDVSTRRLIDVDFGPVVRPVEVAEAGGFKFEEISKLARREAIEKMSVGLKCVLKKLCDEGRINGVIAIGGADGVTLAAPAIRELPLGMPKVMISPIFQGSEEFGPFVGTRDVVLIHSVVDIAGINSVSRIIFDNAVAALAGMVMSGSNWRQPSKGKAIAITMYGNTTPGVMKAKAVLEKEGFEVVIFHPNGTGGRAMEELIEQGYFVGVLDYTPHEVVDELLRGLHRAGPHRLEAACKVGIPNVVVPGCVDFILMGPYEDLPEEIKRTRLTYKFNPLYTLVKITKEEAMEVGKCIADKLNRCKGFTAVVFPLKGLSMYDKEGDMFYDPEVTAVILKTLKDHLRADIPLIEVNAHVNDDETARMAAETLIRYIKALT